LRNILDTGGFSPAESDPQSHSSGKARSVRTLSQSTHNKSTRSEIRSRSGNNLGAQINKWE
jgi:hypothetical protein